MSTYHRACIAQHRADAKDRRAAAEPWTACAERARLRDRVAAHRATRRADMLRPARAAVEPATALALASRTAAHRRADTAALKARQIDALSAARQYPLRATELVARCDAAVTGALGWATETERADALGWIVEKCLLVETMPTTDPDWPSGRAPISDRVRIGWLERRVSGHVMDARAKTAAREVRLADDAFLADTDTDMTAEDKIDALAHRAGGSVWAIAGAPQPLASAITGNVYAERCAAVTADWHTNESHAVRAALGGYGSGGKAMAAQLGCSESTGRYWLADGKTRLRERGVTELRTIFADAQALGAPDEPTRYTPNATERAAAEAIDQCAEQLRRTRRYTGTYGRKDMSGRLSFGNVHATADTAQERAEQAARTAWHRKTTHLTKIGMHEPAEIIDSAGLAAVVAWRLASGPHRTAPTPQPHRTPAPITGPAWQNGYRTRERTRQQQQNERAGAARNRRRADTP